MSGRVHTKSHLIRAVAEELSLKEIEGLLVFADAATIDLFGELAFNLAGSDHLCISKEDKTLLKRYKKQLTILISKKERLLNRQAALVEKPLLAQLLAKLAVKCASDLF